MDELQPFFESRETRANRLPAEARGRFLSAALSARQAGDTEFEDKQFVSLWLAQRTGLPRKQVLDNFGGIATRFFGPGTTAAGAYDRIAGEYKAAGGGGSQDPDQGENATPGAQAAQKDEEYADVAGFPKPGAQVFLENVGQVMRSIKGGFEGVAQKVPAGLYSQGAAVTAPILKDVSSDPEWIGLKKQNETLMNPYQFTQVYDSEPNMYSGPGPEGEKIIAANSDAMMAIARRVDAENKATLAEWAKTNVGAVSQEYRRLAGFWYELSGDALDRSGVNPEFQKSVVGQFAASAGSVPATAALAALGIPGAVGLESMFFADVESERMQAEGAAYDPAKALPANLASALPQMVLERAFGVERLMNKVLGEIPKQAGKVAFGDFAKQFIRQGLAAGVEEGITEPTQGFWNDYMAQMTYDQQRETLTGDGAKRRLLESVSAFALGSMFGGGITTLETIDRNRAVGKGAEYLTTKTGQLLTESDFNVLREVKTDEQILGTAPDPETGKVLLAAANGNKAAQADYNNRVMAAQFVKTDGMEVGGMTLGLVQETPVVKMADGVIVPLDMTNKEDAAFVDSFKAEVVKAQALKETVDFLNKRIEVGRQVEVSPEVKTLQDFINEAKIEVTDAAKRIGIAQDVTEGAANIPAGAKPADVQVLGANFSEYTAGVYRDVSRIYAGGDPLIAVEEVAEGYLKKRLAVGDLAETQISEWRTAYENATGEKTATTGTVSNIEWFSKRVVDYAVANREAVGLPKSWEGFFRTLGEHIKTVFKMAERIIKMKKDGQLPADFENAIKGALGLMEVSEVTDAIERRDTAPMPTEEEMQPATAESVDEEMLQFAESQADFPKIVREGENFLVSSPTGEEIGTAKNIEAAQTQAMAWYDAQYRGEEMAAIKKLHKLDSSISRLLTDVRKLGGLPAISTEKIFKGELRAIADGLPTHLRLKLFRKKGLQLDALRESLNGEGYNYETVTDLLDDLDDAVRLLAEKNARGYKVTFALTSGKISKEQVDMFSGGTTGGDTLFNLQGEEAQDFTGIVDKQAASAEDKKAAEKAQLGLDITFATTGIPQNAIQALQAQAQRIRSKKLMATGELLARIQAGQSIPARVRAVRRSTQASLLARMAVPISSRLAAIAPELSVRLRRFEFDTGTRLTQDYQRVLPFAQAMEAMKDGDAALLDLALKNGDTDTRDMVLATYGIQAQFAEVLKVIDETRLRAEAAGYEVAKIDNYFPRKVADLDGLMVHFYGRPEAGHLEKAIKAASDAALAQGRVLTAEERMEVVNTALRGYGPRDARPGNLKTRSVDVVDVDANAYYTDSVTALSYYLETMNAAIEKRRFFGKYSVPVPGVPGANTSRINLEASIGGLLEDLIARDGIDRQAQQEVQAILEARFNQTSSSEFIKNFKGLAYMSTMGQVTSSLTQLSDLAFSLYENGVYDTVIAGGKAVARQSTVTRASLGLENVAAEFRETGSMHNAVDRVFKLVGIHYLDLIGKETLTNAKLRKMQREARAGRLSQRTADLINRVFGPQAGAQVIQDLAAGKVTPDVQFAVYNVLADFQPVSLSEYPEFYLRHPNGRVFYMLKTFTLKQIDAFRREALTQIVRGNAKQKAEGFRNLIHLAGLLYIIGVPVDWLKDWIMARDPQLSDIAIDNVFKLLGVNRWNLWQFRESRNPVQAALLLVAPPAPLLVYPLTDIAESAEKVSEGDEVKPGEFESWRMLPFIGAPIYWYLGGGEAKVEKRRQKREKAVAGESRIKR